MATAYSNLKFYQFTYVDSHILLCVGNNHVWKSMHAVTCLSVCGRSTSESTGLQLICYESPALLWNGCRMWRHEITGGVPLTRTEGLISLLTFAAWTWGEQLFSVTHCHCVMSCHRPSKSWPWRRENFEVVNPNWYFLLTSSSCILVMVMKNWVMNWYPILIQFMWVIYMCHPR